jgi:hypothetical protein
MITPTHDDVHPPFGPLFTQNFLVMVDEYAAISEIIERCTTRPVLQDTRGIEAAGLYGKHP